MLRSARGFPPSSWSRPTRSKSIGGASQVGPISSPETSLTTSRHRCWTRRLLLRSRAASSFCCRRKWPSGSRLAPATSAYGALSIGVQAVARAERLFSVSAGAFHPRPQVDSAVLRLTPLEQPLIPLGQQASFRAMVVGLFGFRRKQLLRGLRELTGWEPARAGERLERAAIDPTARPEMLSPADFVRLHHALVDGGWQRR